MAVSCTTWRTLVRLGSSLSIAGQAVRGASPFEGLMMRGTPEVTLPVGSGEKYALIALNAATDIQSALDHGGGFSALPRGSIVLPEHWKQWLGSTRSERIER